MLSSHRDNYDENDLLISGRVTSPTSSTDPRKVTIEVEDQRSSEDIVRFTLSAEQFLALISGGSVRIKGAHLGKLDRVGKLMHVYSEDRKVKVEADDLAAHLRDTGWHETSIRTSRDGYKVVARYWGDDTPPAV